MPAPAKSLDEAVAAVQKAHGEGVGGRNYKHAAFAHLPVGIAPLDVALGGGIPIGATTLVYGNPSSGKTQLCLRAVGQFQRRYPDKKVVWFDAENCYDAQWAALHGVNTEELYVFKPTFAEEAANIADEVAYATDVGMIVIDSIAGLAALEQLEKEAEKTVIAGAARPVKRMLQKIGAAGVEHQRAGRTLTVLCINHLVMKIGMVFGNPEALPGPGYQNYMAFCKIKTRGRPILKEKIAPVPIYSENVAVVEKAKFARGAVTAEWNTILYPHQGHKPPDVNNARTLDRMLTDAGALVKAEKEWALWGEVFPTKTAAIEDAIANYDVTISQLVDDLIQLYKDNADGSP